MHWSPTDIPSLIKLNAEPDLEQWKIKWTRAARFLNKRRDLWKRAVKDVPIMYDFLKEHHYGSSKKKK